ncbi:MAG: ABC transporter ATP-binding protein [Acidimicrobiia bacterium]|nr:ABC transporter ATP-binding protein [Acidimicrobiia bacterium]
MSLELRAASKRYPNGAVGADKVDLRIDEGSFVALFGPSGSGKTSQLHMLGLLQRPDTGEVWIDGERVDQASEGGAAKLRRTKLGFVFQSASLLRLASARENVDVSMRLSGRRGGDARTRDEAALDSVGMSGRMDHRPDEMSGGEQQRVSIARALVHEPRYLLADEPTGELDTVTGAGILQMLRDIADRGTTIVMATHDPAAIDYVDTAYFVESGTLRRPDRSDLALWLTEGTEF